MRETFEVQNKRQWRHMIMYMAYIYGGNYSNLIPFVSGSFAFRDTS